MDLRPPFNEETARAKVKAAEDTWNTKDPQLVAKTYTEDCQWRNRAEFFKGRDAETGQWIRSHGNEHWEFDANGLIRRRDMSANDYPINESERRYLTPA